MIKYRITSKNDIKYNQSPKETEQFIYTKLDAKQGKTVYLRLLRTDNIAFIDLRGKHHLIERM